MCIAWHVILHVRRDIIPTLNKQKQVFIIKLDHPTRQTSILTIDIEFSIPTKTHK